MSAAPGTPRIRLAHIAPDVLFQEVAGEAVLLNLSSERYFGLDAVGTRIWQLIEQEVPVDDIAARIGEEFDAPLETIASDLHELLGQLADAGLIIAE
jgi:hypothetical protein